MGPWIRGECTPENLKNLMENGFAVLFRVTFYDIRLIYDRWPVPYLSEDKCTGSGFIRDNGRVLAAEMLTTTLTDIDFRILISEYDFNDMQIEALYFSKYEPLPAPIRGVIRSYYEQKTALKGSEDDFQKLLYEKAKNMLNGLFGMMAQDPVKESLAWNGREFMPVEEDPREILAKHNKKTCLSYAWGVWCTAWARLRLEQMINTVGPDDFIYCDTDSVKYVDKGQSWIAYNAKRKADSVRSKAHAVDSKGIEHYMGVVEPDGEYLRFATLGAKRYAYDDMDGKLHITISGVDKKAGAAELGRLENFKPDFIFLHPGKTEAIYNDFPVRKQFIADGKAVEIVSYVIIRETTYKLSLSEDYENLLRLVNDGHSY